MYLTIDGVPAYQIGYSCGTCGLVLRRQPGAASGPLSAATVRDRLNAGLDGLDTEVIDAGPGGNDLRGQLNEISMCRPNIDSRYDSRTRSPAERERLCDELLIEGVSGGMPRQWLSDEDVEAVPKRRSELTNVLTAAWPRNGKQAQIGVAAAWCAAVHARTWYDGRIYAQEVVDLLPLRAAEQVGQTSGIGHRLAFELDPQWLPPMSAISRGLDTHPRVHDQRASAS